jgi:peptidoglycan/xylan/chitin deacetylase (PgdA/CDA1 family)
MLAGALVSALAVAVAVAGCGSGGPSLGSAGQAHLLSLISPRLGVATPSPARLYRIVGCRSHGSLAYSHGPHRYEVAIGFDDGPAQDTPAFVTMLARSHATATFFSIGDEITPEYRTTMLRELREGDVIGDHTYTHPYLTRTGKVRAQLQRTIAAINAQTGYTPCVFRPPYGAYDSSVLQIARSLGLATIMWNVDPSDYMQPGTATIVHRVLSQVQPGSLLISHDGGGPRGQTLAAYPRIISALRRRGFGIVTIPQLLGFRPVYEPCARLCDGLGIPRSRVPHEAIIQQAP